MLTKSNDPQDAIGLRIMLVQVEAEFQGKPCKAVRIRKPPALRAAEAPKPPPNTPKAEPAKRSRSRKTTAEELDDNIPY
jgi:hypothetical protein